MISPELGLTDASGTLTGPETKVIYSPILHEVSFQNASGTVLGTPQPILRAQSAPGETPESLSQLVEMQNIAGDDTPISSPELIKETGVKGPTFNARINHIGQYMPEELVGCTRTEGKTMLTFGSFAVAVSLETPTKDERTTAEARRMLTKARAERFGVRQPISDAIDREKFELRKANVEAKDKAKGELTKFDNARIQIGNKNYAIELREPIDLLAVRTMAALARAPHHVVANKTSTYSRKEFEQYVWDSMTIAERQLYGGGANAAYDEKPTKILDHLQAFMTTLGQRSGQRNAIINYAATLDTFTMASSTLLQIFINRPEGPSAEGPSLISDINRESIDQMVATRREIRASRRTKKQESDLDISEPEEESADPTPEDRAWVETWLQDKQIGQEEAVRALDRLTSRSGNAALREAFGADTQAFQQAKRRSHNRIHSALRGGYWQALANRTIAGNTTTGDQDRLQQISGELYGGKTKRTAR
jgi:hypothetical protein